MRFLIYPLRGRSYLAEAESAADAIADAGDPVVSISAWCLNPGHPHYPDGQWEECDDLLDPPAEDDTGSPWLRLKGLEDIHPKGDLL